MNRFAILLFSMALTSCQTTEELQARLDADLDAKLDAYNGSTIAQFIAQTSMLPTNAYPAGNGRVFVFHTAPVFTTLPATDVTPAVTRSAECQVSVQTVPTGSGGTADNWIITGTNHVGRCNLLLL